MLINDGWIPVTADVARVEDACREREQHLRVARQLAREIGAPEARVVAVYERELERLTRVARVKQFLAIFILKNVKMAFEQRESQSAVLAQSVGFPAD